MEKIFGLLWRRSSLMVICLVFTLGAKGGMSQSLQCYSCTDQGEGGCLPENAVNVSCSSDHNVCLETLSGIKTSHHRHIILKKGCGSGVASEQDKTISFHGISIFIKQNACNSSLCNSILDVRKYDLAADNITSRVPNDGQCYSCIGKPREECSPSRAPVMSCFDTYSHCFDGNVAITIGNDTSFIPVKSCSQRFHCAVQTATYGSTSFAIKGACCSEDLCNQDLSNETQVAEVPYLVLLNENNEEIPTTTAPAPWVTPTSMVPTTKHIQRDAEVQPSLNSTASSHSNRDLQDGQTNIRAYGLVYAPWLICFLFYLS